MMIGRWKAAASLLMMAALAACSDTGPATGPSGQSLADGTCVQLRNDLNTMDKRGVPGMIDARNNGKKYGAQQDAEINRYNQVLDQYLGGQCASEQRYKARAGLPQAAPTAPSGRYAASLTTGSVPKGQVKRRKPADEDEPVAKQASAPADEPAAKPVVRRKTARSTAGEGTPAPTAVKAESGLPAAPPPPTKTQSSDKND